MKLKIACAWQSVIYVDKICAKMGEINDATLAKILRNGIAVINTLRVRIINMLYCISLLALSLTPESNQ